MTPFAARHASRAGLGKAVLAATLCLGAALVAATPATAAPSYETGDRVEVTGLVTGPDGTPLADVRVVLERARETFDLRTFGRTKKKIAPVATTTDAAGAFEIVFPWDSFYNDYELVVGVMVRSRRGERLVELERLDLTRQIERGSPVAASVVVANAAFVTNFRAFLAGLSSADENRVYSEQGKPDKVENIQYPDRTEATWWYFDSGQVYRFVNGRLTQVEQFDPVAP